MAELLRIPHAVVNNLLLVWDFCTVFSPLLKLSPFTLQQLAAALQHPLYSPLATEVTARAPLARCPLPAA